MDTEPDFGDELSRHIPDSEERVYLLSALSDMSKELGVTTEHIKIALMCERLVSFLFACILSLFVLCRYIVAFFTLLCRLVTFSPNTTTIPKGLDSTYPRTGCAFMKETFQMLSMKKGSFNLVLYKKVYFSIFF